MKKRLLTSFVFTLFIAFVGYGQRNITGKVTDLAGEPLIGANVIAKEDPTVGTVTDFDGNFSLTVGSNITALVISYTGYTSQDVVLTSLTNYTIMLAAGQVLDELVVVGYGSKSARYNTQSVAVLNAASIKNKPVLSPQELLQGQAAGVQMVNSSGVLGAQANLRIRGAASITGGGQPLFVVDGVPMNDEVRSTAQGAGTGLNPLMNINPADIESMTVLKDAAAVAIYGSRGSNGVVVIKTKSGGKGGKTNINLDYYSGWSNATNLVQMLNTNQFSEFNNAWRSSRNLAAQTLPTDYFDWPTEVVQTGRSNSINLSASGGTEKTSYYIGGSFLDESGFTIGNESQRFSGRVNLNHQANEWLSFGTNLSYSNVNMDRIGAENNTFAPLTSAYLQLPYVLPRDADGNYRNTGFIANILAIEELNTNYLGTRRTTGNVFANINILPGLVFRTDWGLDEIANTEKRRNVNIITPGGSAGRDINNDYKWLSTNTLAYDKDFGSNSRFSLLGGYSYETSRFLGVYVAGNGFASDGLPNVNSASTPTLTDEQVSQWALESQFARASTNISGKYIGEVTVRRDGSSRFGANQRYGVFWAVSGGWILSEENFLKNNELLNFLKLTASYGTAGNDRIGNFSSLALYGGGVLSDYAGSAGLRPIQTPNPDLTWETTAQLDLGISTQLFNNRISLDLNWYDKRTSGLLLNVPLPFTTGFASYSRNVGTMQNTGVDIDLKATIVKTSDLNWNLGFNIGFLKNKVLELPDASIDVDGNPFVQGSASQRAVVGRSLNEFYMVRHNGVNPQTGDFEWLDKNGNPTTTYSANDRVFVGSAIPKYVGGISTSLDYKSFDFSALFNFTYGNKVFINGLTFMENLNPAAGFNKSVSVLDYWKESGDVAFAPRLNSATAPLFNQVSTNFLMNGSFLRLRNVQLGYTIPASAFGGQNVIQGARIYVLGQNLWMLKDKNFRGPDPEVSANGASNLIQGESFFALPQAKIFTVGANLNF
jgi:TonB-dependent starch-binding outer membrane protein SusC